MDRVMPEDGSDVDVPGTRMREEKTGAEA